MKFRFKHEKWRGLATVGLVWTCGYVSHMQPCSALIMLVAGIVILWGEN